MNLLGANEELAWTAWSGTDIGEFRSTWEFGLLTCFKGCKIDDVWS